jgi:hypothetical protein
MSIPFIFELMTLLPSISFINTGGLALGLDIISKSNSFLFSSDT